MTVKELIVELKKFEPNMPVIVGQEDGAKGEIVDIRAFYGSVNSYYDGHYIRGHNVQSMLKIVCGTTRWVKNEPLGIKYRGPDNVKDRKNTVSVRA